MPDEAPGASAPSNSSSSGSAAPAPAPASAPGAPSSQPSTSQPSTAPSSAPASPASSEPSGEYAFLESLFDPPSGDEGTQPRTEATVLPVTQQAALGVEPQQQSVVPQATPAPQQGQQETTPQASTGTLDPADPAAIANAMLANEAFMIDQVASAMFSMTPEDVGALETDFVGTIPKLLAKAVVKAQQQQLAVLSKIVPAMLTKYVSDYRAHSTNEAKFYARWPGLNPQAHGPLVQRYAATYRQMHPNATLESMIEDLGPMLYIAAKVNPMQPVAPQNPTANGSRPPQAAFVPAGAGVTSQQSAPQAGTFDFLGQRE